MDKATLTMRALRLDISASARRSRSTAAGAMPQRACDSLHQVRLVAETGVGRDPGPLRHHRPIGVGHGREEAQRPA